MPSTYYKKWLAELPIVAAGWNEDVEHASTYYRHHQGRVRIVHYIGHGIAVWSLHPDGSIDEWIIPKDGDTLAQTTQRALDANLETGKTQ